MMTGFLGALYRKTNITHLRSSSDYSPYEGDLSRISELFLRENLQKLGTDTEHGRTLVSRLQLDNATFQHVPVQRSVAH